MAVGTGVAVGTEADVGRKMIGIGVGVGVGNAKTAVGNATGAATGTATPGARTTTTSRSSDIFSEAMVLLLVSTPAHSTSCPEDSGYAPIVTVLPLE